jgi:hypothetical protein
MDLALLAQSIASQYTPAAVGMKSRIAEPDTVQAILESVAAGNYFETAAAAAGISRQTLSEWLQRGETGEQPFKVFADALKRAEARAEAEAVHNVRKAGLDPRFWAAEMTYLERRHPDRYARRSEDSNTPRVLVQVGVQTGTVQVQLTQDYAKVD